METQVLVNKLKKLDKFYQKSLHLNLMDIDSIHKLRIKTRELLSCIDKENPFYTKLKKVIKLTNEIRDIDVFQNEFLENLPLELKQHIDLDLMAIHLTKLRELNCKNLQEYMLTLEVPVSLSPRKLTLDDSEGLIQKVELKSFSQKELHRYRIYIKKELYFYKAFHPERKEKIKVLTKIKDSLGFINDNFNAQKRITTFISVNEEELLSYIENENKRYLEKVLKLKTTLEF